MDLCPDGEAPAVDELGFASCSVMSRWLSEQIVAHNETGERLYGWEP